MVTIEVKRSSIGGIIRCPPSKSYTHRAIAIASLTNEKSTIINPLLSRDTLATISGCKLLGVAIDKSCNKDDSLNILGKNQFDTPKDVINAANSGTTIRLLSSMAALVKNGYTILTGDNSLRTRPMKPILVALNQLGVTSFSSNSADTPPLVIKGGGIKGGIVNIDGSISSQFISSLLISCIYANSKVEINVIGKQVSIPYIEATLYTMKKFGVEVICNKNYTKYLLPQSGYNACNFIVPGDFSSAALMISAGILCSKKLIIDGLNFDYPQGDLKIIDIVKKMGGDISIDHEKGQIIVLGSNDLDGIECELVDTPDLLPVVSILALRANSPTKIFGISHARFKETDRVANITKELRKMGVKIVEKYDEILIQPPKILRNAELDSYNDHRLFMAFTIASLLTERSIVKGAESVDVSYPYFFNDLKKLGAELDIVE